MNSTLSDIKQMFNVTSIAPASTTLENLADGQLGIYAEDAVVTTTATTFATLPAKYRLLLKKDGKVYTSLDTIDKAKTFNQVQKPYLAEQVDIWKGVITNTKGIESVVFKVNIDEQSLIQRDGLTWTHQDFVVSVSPEEILNLVPSELDAVYENHVVTELLYNRINALNSPFYEAGVQIEGGAELTTPAAVAAHIATNKAVNTDGSSVNNTANLVLIIKGKASSPRLYRDLDVNYVYPRGVNLKPSVIINGTKNVLFTETQKLRYEIGAGYDLRAEEFQNMNYYTNLNFYPTLSDGIASNNLIYQFANNTNYGTVNFEVLSSKTGLQDVPEGNNKKFGVLLASATPSVQVALAALFVPA